MRRTTTPSPSSGARLWAIEGSRATMLDAIVSGLASLRSALPRSAELPADLDIVASAMPDGATIAETVRLLVTALMSEMMADQGQLSLFTAGTSAELEGLTRAAASLPVSAAQRRDALGYAAAMIREVGLERYDLDCQLASEKDGTAVIVSAPVPVATAHVWLLDRLFQRAEAFVIDDEVLTCERMASAWYFSQWSVGGRGLDPEGMAFTRRVREQEWSLVERETVTLGLTVMDGLARHERFAEVPARQQRLARALGSSILDIFAVEAVDGNRLTLRSVRGGRAHRVHEHNESARLEPGYFVIGRLIPFDSGLWLRSPGTVSFAPRRADEAAVLAGALEQAARALPLPIAIEALISTVVLGGKPPIAPKPAPSAAEARRLVQFMTDALDRLGLREAVPAEAMPNDVLARLRRAGSELAYFRISADEALVEWMGALSEQAERGETGPARSSHGTKGRGGKKGKKNRRR